MHGGRQSEVVQLSWTQLGRGFELGFEVVWRLVTEQIMPSFGVVTGNVVADFEFGLGRPGKAAAGGQLGLETALKRFDVGVVVAVTASAHALLGSVTRQ